MAHRSFRSGRCRTDSPPSDAHPGIPARMRRAIIRRRDPGSSLGLPDIIQGMKNGPRGQRQPSSSGSGGGMSRIMMALLALFAYKTFKGRGGQAAPTDSARPSTPAAAAPLAEGSIADKARKTSRCASIGARRNRGRQRLILFGSSAPRIAARMTAITTVRKKGREIGIDVRDPDFRENRG